MNNNVTRIYYRTSLFLYTTTDDPSPVLCYYRITEFTFWKPEDKDKMDRVLRDWIEEKARCEYTEIREPFRYAAFEAEQVEPSESKGLGFNYYAVSHTKQRDEPERVLEVFFRPAYEKADVRLGHGPWMATISKFAQAKKLWSIVRRKTESIWGWLTRGG